MLVDVDGAPTKPLVPGGYWEKGIPIMRLS